MSKTLLTKKVIDRINSKKLTNFEEVVSFFTLQFDDLTDDIKVADESVVKIARVIDKQEVYFDIMENELGLKSNGGNIDVIAVRGYQKRFRLIGEVSFNGGYCVVKFPDQKELHYLTKDILVELFMEAFEFLVL